MYSKSSLQPAVLSFEANDNKDTASSVSDSAVFDHDVQNVQCFPSKRKISSVNNLADEVSVKQKKKKSNIDHSARVSSESSLKYFGAENNNDSIGSHSDSSVFNNKVTNFKSIYALKRKVSSISGSAESLDKVSVKRKKNQPNFNKSDSVSSRNLSFGAEDKNDSISSVSDSPTLSHGNKILKINLFDIL